MKAQYLYHRQAGRTASRAITMARIDQVQGTSRYPAPVKPYPAVSWQEPEPIGNLPFPQYSKRGLAHIENPASAGLRLVGRVAAEFRGNPFSRSDSTGWLTDPHGDVFKNGTGLCYGLVYQLPGHNGTTRLVAGYQFGGCDGGPTLDLGTVYTIPRGGALCGIADCDATRQAARAADSMAEKAAEEAREYHTAWQAGSAYASAAEEITESRAELLDLLKERKAAMRAGADSLPAICRTIKREASRLLRDIRQARNRRANLASGDAPDLYFWPGKARLKDAFCEGANLDAFPA